MTKVEMYAASYMDPVASVNAIMQCWLHWSLVHPVCKMIQHVIIAID